MSGKLLQEIHKVKPFESVQQEAFLNVIRTADHLMRGFEELLKPHNLSPTQYNVLRILRGTGGCCDGAEGNGKSPGVPCKKIGEHMITREPDITRLLDRLEGRGLITRQRDTEDRRVVSTRITAEGLRILQEIDQPVNDFHTAQFPNLAEGKLVQLIELLEQART
ncbi:MAG TPA: MarR family transcriptional regulator [Phycisphaerae bacterium]|jgi:DNA-binding MarR family transcriptional regulator|nr:MarR family transcriptional regulator [Phycisphaerae bacterium]